MVISGWEKDGIRLHLTAGEGVGMVTKPDSCGGGKPAINPVPREMDIYPCREGLYTIRF